MLITFRRNSVLAFIPAILILTGCSATPPFAQSPSSEVQVDSEQSFSNDSYADVLKTYVDENGLVEYSGLQANRQLLDEFVAAIGAVSPSTYESWSDAEKIAFLINAYNAFTLQAIIDQAPLKGSIRDIFGVWNIRQFTIAQNRRTLDNIEHGILRKDFNEPRIHMALVCAAISCPNLRNEPYTAAQLDRQLDDQVQQFLTSPKGLQIDRSNNRVAVSSIFKWFGEDWQKSYRVTSGFNGSDTEKAVLNFIGNYVGEDDRNYLIQGTYQLNYLDYDWSLNKQIN
ncbi:MAG: DUF547 domain-containing protein [Cyanobacteria bacterium CRU_2_1]|nr:DUF547 domain-containing protein [Cyanobacteria bacterium RU_5_0]NJR61731.1 DUF547 domain-containing protein [Cyanobacteria bacterium CRU_2_1]